MYEDSPWGNDSKERALQLPPASSSSAFSSSKLDSQDLPAFPSWSDNDAGTSNAGAHAGTRWGSAFSTAAASDEMSVGGFASSSSNNRLEDDGWDSNGAGAAPSFHPPSSYSHDILPSSYDQKEAAVEESATAGGAKDEDWGDYGNDDLDLPPLAAAVAAPARPPSPSPSLKRRGSGWDAPDDSWRPAVDTLSNALPSFGSSFSVAPARSSEAAEAVEEGWGGSLSAASWSVGGVRDFEEQETNDGRRSLSTPAVFIESLKTESRRLSNENWPVPSDAFDDPSMNTSKADRPVSILLNRLLQAPLDDGTAALSYRRSPTVAAGYREGLDRTSMKAAETLKGTSSMAYRNARFGSSKAAAAKAFSTASSLDGGAMEGGRIDGEVYRGGKAGDEFDLDAPNRAAPVPTATKSRWWSSSAGQPTPDIPSIDSVDLSSPSALPEPIIASSSSPTIPSSTSSPDLGSSAIGRFLGRFGSKPAASSRPSSPLDSDRSTSLDLSSSSSPSKTPFDAEALDAFFGEPTPPTLPSKIAVPRKDAPSRSTASAAARMKEEGKTVKVNMDELVFDGLLFGESMKQQSREKTKKTTASRIDVFDPFGIDEEQEATTADSVPSRISRPFPPTSLINTGSLGLSPSLDSSDRNTIDDISFDSFFSPPAPPPPSTVRAPTTLPSSILPPPPPPAPSLLRRVEMIQQTRTPSPVPSSSSISGSTSSFFLAPPPRSMSSLLPAVPTASVIASTPVAPAAVLSSVSTSGTLSMADLDFFES